MPDERFRAAVAVHLFLVRDGRVLLLRRYNTGYEDGSYSVPAGHLDGGEEVRVTAAREALEEVGIEVAPEGVDIVVMMHRKAEEGRVDFFVAVSSWNGEISNCESHKCDELSWFPLDALPGNTIPYLRRALENYRPGASFESSAGSGRAPEDVAETMMPSLPWCWSPP